MRNTIKQLKKGEALVKEIWDLCILPPNENPCDNLRYYYENLEAENTKINIEERRKRVQSSEQSMCIRYKMIIGSCYSMTLYNSCLDESKRVIITRWRLSSHKLKIETGRHTKPITERKDRLCTICNVIDDEEHAIYFCNAHRLIRDKYKNILNFEHNIQQLLNPKNINDATNLGMFLNEIEENMKELGIT